MFDSPLMTAFTVAEFTLIYTYIGLILYLIWYLRRVHTAMWVQLGRPWMPTGPPE